ncbi:MAG TPA: ABC transporter substrate-binding protein, partial [Acidimicrobiales bacterium]|nr:ABC transporter substrate-binding protein [Acidimicrobiales bacterium]
PRPVSEPAQAMSGVIKYAESPGANPNYIFPETSTANQSIYNNSQFINLMWPLIYTPAPVEPVMDYKNSMAYPPVVNSTGTVFTVHLRHWLWSDGQPVTARDLTFYINLGEAMGATWGNYSGPTQFPYNIKSTTILNPTTVRFVMKSPINPTYFIDNGIDYITPMPQHAWDKTSVNGPVGNYDETPSGAKAVLKFLQAQAAQTSTYATNPLWKVVDGPWTLKAYGGQASPTVFVPNPHYSGVKPTVAQFQEIPFTSDTAEYTALRAGNNLNYGYVPPNDVPSIGSLKRLGYHITQVYDWGFDYMIPNLKNPQVGPILSQLYVRQVLSTLTDQNSMIKRFMYGYGVPGYGPTPVNPRGNPFISTKEMSNPYPFSVSKAKTMLIRHGWKLNPGGVDTCASPGSGPNQCGAGIAAGAKLAFNLLYANDSTVEQEDNDLFAADASEAGIQITAKSTDFNTVISTVQQCGKDKTAPTCTWQLGEYGGIGESTYPSGEGLINTGGAFNAGSFSDPLLDKYINQSTVSTNLGAYKNYENRWVEDDPWIIQPDPAHLAATYHLSGYGLTTEFNGYRNYIQPNFWRLSK